MDAIQIQQEQILDTQVHQQLLGLAGEMGSVSPGRDSCTVLEIIMTTALSDILKHQFYRCFTCTYVCVPCAHSTHKGQPWVGITSHRHRQFKTLTDAHSRPGPAKSLREEEQEAEQKRVDRLSGITCHWIHTHAQTLHCSPPKPKWVSH